MLKHIKRTDEIIVDNDEWHWTTDICKIYKLLAQRSQYLLLLTWIRVSCIEVTIIVRGYFLMHCICFTYMLAQMVTRIKPEWVLNWKYALTYLYFKQAIKKKQKL